MMRGKKFKRETTHNGTLNTPISFFKMAPSSEIYEQNQVSEKVYETFAEVYNPSSKDMEVMKSKGIKRGLTIKIRDPLTSYTPSNSDTVSISGNSLEWGIADIRPDFKDKSYLIILLSGN